MRFWNEPAVDRSFSVLQHLKKRYELVLIGGWAVWLYTKKEKSKDIDIIVDFPALERIRGDYAIKRNERLRKYEISFEGISVDIYVPHYSALIIPPEIIMKNTDIVEGFRVPAPEYLLALKQQAEIERKDSVKGMKDRVDIISLMIYGDIDVQKYLGILGEKREEFSRRLLDIINSAGDEFPYLGILNYREVKKIRALLRERIENAYDLTRTRQ